MTNFTILEYPDPRLRKVAVEIDQVTPEITALADNMLRTMYDAPGIGLAATQVDHHVRLLVADVSEGRDQPYCLINPEIIAREGEVVNEEGCLSVPEIFANVKRSAKITVTALDKHGTPFELEAEDLLAICIQHEMDHLKGILFVDHLSPLKRRMIDRRLQKQRRQGANTAHQRSATL
ncbi:MAG: peptide deformylase [Gammaproteobacteria bacterium]|nr:peptide deformylase [Gammaproteobacteria bacterium]